MLLNPGTQRAVPGRPEAAAAALQERAQMPAVGRRRAMRAVLVVAAAGALWLYGARSMAAVLLVFSICLLGAARFAPRASLMFETAVSRLARLVGRAITAILMAAVFYLFITPFGRWTRRGDRDRLRRRREPTSESYWESHDGQTAASESLTRQY